MRNGCMKRPNWEALGLSLDASIVVVVVVVVLVVVTCSRHRRLNQQLLCEYVSRTRASHLGCP